MEWQFYIIQGGVETEIEEPPGWDALDKTLQRDAEMHGMVFSFSAGTLEFVETAYWIIKEEYTLNRVDGNIGLKILANGELFYSGGLDFQRYEERCGESCSITIGLQAGDTEVMIKNRMDTDVDLTSPRAYDAITVLTDYPGLGRTLTVPSKSLSLLAGATSTPGLDDDGNPVPDPGYEIIADADFKYFNTTEQSGWIIPKLNNTVNDEIPDFKPNSILDYVAAETLTTDGNEILDLKPLALDSGVSLFDIDFRFKGNLHVEWSDTGVGNTSTQVRVRLYRNLKYGPAAASQDATFEEVIKYEDVNGLADHSLHVKDLPFDISWTGSVPMKAGDKIWAGIPINFLGSSTGSFGDFSPFTSLKVTWDDASFFTVKYKSATVATPAVCYMIHEAASRVVENITNGAYRFKSEHYGRTDSQPYNFPANGCGGLRAITNGLLLRRSIKQDGTRPAVFASLKTIFESLNAVDCVGMGIEGADVRVEPLEYFYTDEVIFRADGVDEIKISVRNERVYNQFSTGYDKFETESKNGLDAVHTKRQYRQQIKNTDAKLEKISKIIADGYAIEFTRRKFGSTEDWRYDQNLFFLCLNAAGQVEQGNISDASNLFDPPTVINYAITPARMALRWFAWLSQGYTGPGSLTFNSGEGNFIARGRLTDTCALEAAPLAENDTVTPAAFFDSANARPFVQPEKISFTYPVGLHEFADIAKKKYGRVEFRQLPGEPWRSGWVDTLKYTPENGDAEFTLITTRPK